MGLRFPNGSGRLAVFATQPHFTESVLVPPPPQLKECSGQLRRLRGDCLDFDEPRWVEELLYNYGSCSQVIPEMCLDQFNICGVEICGSQEEAQRHQVGKAHACVIEDAPQVGPDIARLACKIFGQHLATLVVSVETADVQGAGRGRHFNGMRIVPVRRENRCWIARLERRGHPSTISCVFELLREPRSASTHGAKPSALRAFPASSRNREEPPLDLCTSVNATGGR